MTFTELQKAADAALNETLSNAGFLRTAPGTWNRCSGDELNVVQLQKQSAAETFCVNLGVHYRFLPKPGTEEPLKSDHIEVHDCELMLRLTKEANERDHWWPVSAASVNLVARLMRTRGLSILDAYRIDGELATMDAKRIEDGTSGLLFPLTKVRACLLVARLQDHLGNRDKCLEAATMGVKLAGMAVGPKKALKDILKRCGQPGLK